MLREDKYKPQQLRFVCPVCEKFVSTKEWEDYGMHFHCTEYYLSGRYLKEIEMKKEGNIHLIKL